MLNYNSINEIFGAPLNTVGRPHVPFKIKTWHIVGGIIIAYLAYQGLKKVVNEKLPRIISSNKEE